MLKFFYKMENKKSNTKESLIEESLIEESSIKDSSINETKNEEKEDNFIILLECFFCISDIFKTCLCI
jgi:hypothetical protein